MRRKTSLTLLAAAFALTALSGASAQPSPDRALSPEMQAFREAHEKQRLQDLRTVLRLRPDQETALSAFVQAARPPGPDEGPGARHGPPPSESLSTPQRLDEMARREAQRTGERQRRTDALRAFYTALSPDQRQVFDALMRLQGPRPDHGPRGPGWRGGPPKGPPDRG